MTKEAIVSLGESATAVVNKARGLSAEQIAFRKLVIGGSDANIIMSGDDERILRLWREKRGEIEPEDLSGVLPVRMGQWTEEFNRIWFTEQTGRVVRHSGSEHLSMDYPWMSLTADGITDEGATYWEGKHSSAFAKEEDIIRRYTPQCQHAMLVLDVSQTVLSVFYGTLKYAFYELRADPIYQEQLIAAEKHFWTCVETGEPPCVVSVPVPITPVRKVDMSLNNEWGDAAADWIDTRASAKRFDSASKALKALVDADVIEATGAGVKVTRNKAGSLTIGALK